METTHLENLLSLYIKPNTELPIDYKSIILKKDFDFKEYSEPFIKEFKKNILSKETKEGKTDIIKYYITEIAPYTGKVWYSKNLFVYANNQKIFNRRMYNNDVSLTLGILIVELDMICKSFDIDFKEQTYNCNISFSQFYEFGTKPFKTKIFLNDSSKNVDIPEYVGKKNKTNETIEPEIQTNNEIKITLLNQLGVFDLLTKKGLTNNNIAELLEFITQSQIKKGSINKTLSLLHNEFGQDLNEKYKSQIAQILLAKKIKLNNN
jgi:hypothetical protein